MLFAPFLQRPSPPPACPQARDACQVCSPELLYLDMIVDIHRALAPVTPELLDEFPGHLCPPEMSCKEMSETMGSEFLDQRTAAIMETHATCIFCDCRIDVILVYPCSPSRIDP